MIDYTDFLKDPDNRGWVLGWAVLSDDPWHFVGIFTTEDEATTILESYGKPYYVAYGSNEANTDNFIINN